MTSDRNNVADDYSGATNEAASHPFRKAVVRGLGVVLPPLLTILIFLWAIGVTNDYVLNPTTGLVQEGFVWWHSDKIRDEKDLLQTIPSQETAVDDREIRYRRVGEKFIPYRRVGKKFIPLDVFDRVEEAVERGRVEPRPETANDYYRRFVELRYLPWYYTVPFFLSVFILVLYLLGKFMAAGIGSFFWFRFEKGILQLPLVRNVYSSVKQVSDFLFTEREIEYTRVVAVEYPRKGIWALGLVTGESMLDIRSAANEPVLSVLVPTSPMPVTGFTVTVLKSETVDLNITIDQAFQFIISCGVVVPPQQLQQMRKPAADALPAPTESDQSTEPAASG